MTGADYSLTVAQVIAQVNATLARNDSQTILDPANALDRLDTLDWSLKRAAG